MRRPPHRLPAVLAAILLGAALAGPLRAETPGEFDQRILRQLGEQNPAAVPVFEEANRARAADRHREAMDLYARVFEMAPRFHHALRRQGMEALTLGDRATALALCRRAHDAEPTPENQGALALALLDPAGKTATTPEEAREAFDLAARAAGGNPDSMYEQNVLCMAALEVGNPSALADCSRRLETLAPEQVLTHYYIAILAMTEGRYDDAQAALARAHDLGMGEDDYQRMLASFRKATPLHVRLLRPAEIGAAAWVAGLALLFIAGLALSQAALRAARRGASGGLPAGLRRAYAAVLWLCCAYYYLSIPMVIALVLLAGGGALYAFLVIGVVPIKIALVVLILVLMSLWAILRSLFFRPREGEPGRRLAPEEQPELVAVSKEVAGRVGTAPVDSVYLTPGTEVAVMERGGLLRQLAGRTERCLILGIAALDGMRLHGFRAVLAHEYGHLSNRDTAGGRFALAVRRSLVTMAALLAAGGAAAWYNPAWLFVNGFYRLFLRISQGATRLQEVLADRWAAATYGAAAFEEGLRHVIERQIRFDAHASAALSEVMERGAPLSNLYAYRPAQDPDAAALDQAVAAALVAKSSPYDSHPGPAERFAYIRQADLGHPASAADASRPVWDLLRDREGLEREMTTRIRTSVQERYGVTIPEKDAATA